MQKRILVLAAGAALLFSGMADVASAASSPAPHHPSLTAQAQEKLKSDGDYSGPINGRRNHATVAAIRHYQHAHHLRANGQLDRATKQALGI